MTNFFRKKLSTILLALLITITLVMPAYSLTTIQCKGTMGSIPSLKNNLGSINGEISTSEDRPMALNIAAPEGTQIAFRNVSTIGEYLGDTSVNKTTSGNATNKTSAGNSTTHNASNNTTFIPPPSGIAMSYPDFNFKADAAQVSNMSLLDRMWRNSHFFCTMGRAYEGDTSYPDWILPTEYTKSSIAMNNWYDVNAAALNYTLPGTHLTPRYWSLFDFPY